MARYAAGPLPAALADDEPALRSILTRHATDAGYSVADGAAISTRIVDQHALTPEEWHVGPALFAEIAVS